MEDMARLNKWQFPMKESDDSRLSVSGRMELRQIGERFKKRFPNILGGSYDSKFFTVTMMH